MNSNKRQRRNENKDEVNSYQRQYHENHKEEINSNIRQRRQNHKDERKECYAKNRANEFNAKGDFNTTTDEIPCDTTEYEIVLSPETAVIN
eukprot:scaffold132855_cov40-Cyclotella_meneghiniana.AAC.1